MSILEEMLAMFATTVQAKLIATLHVCESGIFLGLVPKVSLCINRMKIWTMFQIPYKTDENLDNVSNTNHMTI
jgi:hypothetical protein